MCERENSVQHLMFLTAHANLAKSFRQISSQGIHPGQIPILKLLQREEGIRQSEISMSETEICLLKRFLQQMYESIQKFPQEEKITEKEEKEIRKCSECFEN